MQCLAPCRREVWPSQPSLERLLPAIDPETQAVTDRGLLPHCVHCGGDVFLNVSHARLLVRPGRTVCWPSRKRFHRWLRQALTGSLLVIEIGAGFNTPGVVRWPMEQVAMANQRAHFVRVNLEHAEVPEALTGRSVSLRMDAWQAVDGVFSFSL